MKHSKIIDLLNSSKTLQDVTAKGWVRTFRNNQFIALNDGSTLHNIQCVVDFENTAEETLKRITTGAAISVTGELIESKGAGQKFEIQVSKLEILGDSDAEKFPMQPKKHSLEFLRENAHLRVRTNTFGSVMRVRSTLAFAVHQYFQEKGFFYVNTPIITGSDAEGAGEMFRVTSLPSYNPTLIEDNDEKIDFSKFDEIADRFYNNILSFLMSEKSSDYEIVKKLVAKSLSSEKNPFKALILSKPEDIQKFVSKSESDSDIANHQLSKIIFNLYRRFNTIGFNGMTKKSLLLEIKKICSHNGWKLSNNRSEKILPVHSFKKYPVLSLSFYNLFEIKVEKKVDFSKDFFGKETNLTVSGQLEGETYAMALGQIYTFGPTFRAENSNTSRHLAEFWMIEPEVAFNDLADNMDLAEDFIKYVIKYTLEKCEDDIRFLDQRLFDEEKLKPSNERSELNLIEKLRFVIDNNFKRVSYTEAIDILKDSTPNKKKKFQYIINEWGADLQSEHERFLVEKHFKCPVILFDYPAKIKAFYMRLNDNTEPGKETVRAMDILFPGIGEIVGGSQREERYDVLVEKMKALGIDEEELWWYLDTRRFGSAVHSGFGLGFERLVLFVTGMTNIRDVIPFPRTPQNAEF